MDNEKYYESFDWNSFNKLPVNAKNILNLIPKDVKNIIDIGCGNGLITNILHEKGFDVLGVDRSENALKFVKSPILKSNCDSIQVKDKSFDLVLSSELLEHLEDDVFKKTLNEIDRISSKYILISVPNKESLSKGILQCPNCKTEFHNCYHQRTFDILKFKNLYPEYEVLDSNVCGTKVRSYNSFLSKIKFKLVSPQYWEAYYWTKKVRHNPFCPNCETKIDMKTKYNFISIILDVINSIISPKRPFHLVVLLQKKQ